MIENHILFETLIWISFLIHLWENVSLNVLVYFLNIILNIIFYLFEIMHKFEFKGTTFHI
jgi:hypothetical protein